MCLLSGTVNELRVERAVNKTMLHMNNSREEAKKNEANSLQNQKTSGTRIFALCCFFKTFFPFLLRGRCLFSFILIYLFICFSSSSSFLLCFDLSLKHTLTLDAMYRYTQIWYGVCLCTVYGPLRSTLPSQCK